MQFGVLPSSNSPLARKLRADDKARRDAIIARSDIEHRLRVERNDHVALKLRAKRREEQARETPAECVVRIQREVAKKHGILPIDLCSPCRNHRLVTARHEAAFRAASETPLSYPKIGKLFGGLDHTTIMHAIKRHAERNNIPPDQVPRGLGYSRSKPDRGFEQIGVPLNRALAKIAKGLPLDGEV